MEGKKDSMKLQVLVSAVNQRLDELLTKMNIQTDAIIINQGERFAYEERTHHGRKAVCYHLAERGVGLSRNNALMRADCEVCLFSDEDIVLCDGYEEKILKEWEKFKQADILLFNVKVDPKRATYYNTGRKRVRWYNYGRYPAYSISAKTEALHRSGITFSLLFGGGAKYSNGEDSIFLRDCLKKGLRLYATDILIGEETYRESTWFHGYTEKFFYDRGVLYRYLYGGLRKVFALRFLLKNKQEMCNEISLKDAYGLMKKGMREAGGN